MPVPDPRTQQQQTARLEDQAAAESSAALRAGLALAARQLLAEWIRHAGTPDQPLPAERAAAFRTALLRILDRLDPGNPAQLLRQAIRDAYQHGHDQAVAVAGPTRPVRTVSRKLTDAPDQLATKVAADLRNATRLAKKAPLERYADAVVPLAAAGRAATRIEQTTRWAVNRATNEAVAAVADRQGLPRVWVAERNACLHCLAYSGQTAAPGERFPGGLTFADRPLDTAPVDSPPLHPNCRCSLRPWLGAKVDHTDLPTALRREAQRSVLRGDAGASQAARLRATDRLLRRRDLLAPASVRDRARRAVHAGQYPNRRGNRR